MKIKSRKFLSLFLAAVMAISVLPFGIISAFAETSGKYTYSVNADKRTCTITDCSIKNAEVLEIPETLDGYTVTAFNAMLAMSYGGKTVVFPKTLTSYGRYTFCYTDIIENILVAPENPVFSSQDGILFNKDATEILVYPRNKAAAPYSVPDGVVSIAEKAFASSKITDIEFPSSLKSIGFEAFYHCDNLKNVYVPDNVETLEKRVFSYSAALESVRLPVGLTSVPGALFQECKSLCSVQIPSGVTKIEDSAFAYTALTEIVIPDGVTEIATRAFQGCNLTKAVIPASVVSMNGYTFESRYKKNLTIYGMRKSYAQTYALENEINFVALDALSIIQYDKAQIRFRGIKDKTSTSADYKGEFDVRTIAKISQEDFINTFESEENAIKNITDIGFVYAATSKVTDFDIETAKDVARGGKTENYVKAPVTYIQHESDGADYIFTCLISNINDAAKTDGVSCLAYACFNGTYYYFDSAATVSFYTLYTTWMPKN